MFHNCQLERDDILVVNLVMTSQLRSGMYSQKENTNPVFSCAPDERILIPTGGSVTFNRMPTGAHQVK